MSVPSPRLIALSLQPDDPTEFTNPLNQGDVAIFIVFVVIIVGAFSFDMIRTWWDTNAWRRDARKRKRELR